MAEKKDFSKFISKSIDTVVNLINKKYGSGTILEMGSRPIIDIDVIPTGSLALDMATGVMGIPRGRIIEVYGPESHGKTTLALHIIAEAQKLGGKCAFIDAEHALDPKYSKAIGIKIEDLLLSQPDYGEQAISIAEALVKSGKLMLIVIDSVAALVPKKELEGDFEDMQVAAQARMMSRALRRITAGADKTKTTVLFINQIRENIGTMWGNPTTTPGGRALKFWASLRLEIKKVKQVDDKNKIPIAIECNIKVAKNKVAPPFKIAKARIKFGIGIDKAYDLLNCSVALGIVKKASQKSYILPKILGSKKFDGEAVFKAAIESDLKLQKNLRILIKRKYLQNEQGEKDN